MSFWEHPPIEKVFEALGALADQRIEVSGTTARVTSSSRGKQYEVSYDPHTHAIMANDNLSYYKGMLGYPSIAYLMVIHVIPYDERVLPMLRDVPWKDLNTRYKGNFRKTLETVLEKCTPSESEFLQDEVGRIYTELTQRAFSILGPRVTPPEGY